MFDRQKEKLYIAGFGYEGSILVATSTDDWRSLTIHTAYSAACVNDGTTAIAINSNTGDVMAYCSNNFGAAPYAISVIAASNGADRFVMAQSSSIITSSTFPEGIEYDVNMNKLVMGSMGTGDIYGVPPSLSGAIYSETSLHYYDEGDSMV